jgi:5'-deoxynucleotidase YfbR-like HD superfamily hydrolase
MRQLCDRNTELKSILRYGTRDEWYPVFYRPDLLIHTTRVFWITREICKYLKENSTANFQEDIALDMARVHDDSELLAGDIISVRKAEFSEKEKQQYEQKCLAAIEQLSENYSQETK